MNTPAVCYADFEGKRREYPAVVIPAIFTMAADTANAARPAYRGLLAAREGDARALLTWLRGGLDRAAIHGRAQLASLHDLARHGNYRPAKQPCDVLQDAAVTLVQGGPCSAWSVVLGAALDLLRYPWRLVTSGDDADPYRHVYVQAWDAGRWYTLDAKGSQRGQDFDADVAPEKYEVVRYWEANQ
jgi:hypothetical protein